MGTNSPRTDRLAPVLAIAVTVVLWASAFVAIRHVGDQVSPGALTLGRCLVASVVLGALLLVRRRRSGAPGPRPTRPQWARLVVCGVLWFGAYNVALNAAEQRVDAGTAAMLVNVGPILIAVLAGLLLGEGFPQRLLIGSLVAFGGVVLIGVSTSTAPSTDAWGVLLCLGAAAAYAVAVIAQKPLLATLPALEVTWIACTIGGLSSLPFAGALWSDLSAAGGSALFWVVYLGVMPTAVAFTTWAYALARSSAGRLGSTTYLVPPLTIVLGWSLLGETPPAWAVVGGAVCLVGVSITRSRPRSPRPLPGDHARSPRRRGRGTRAGGCGMTDARGVARLAHLLADETRATICLSLLDGRAWTATELAHAAGVAPSTASAHLDQLVDGGLLAQERQGRHRYLRLADARAATLVEDLAAHCDPAPAPSGSLRVVSANAALVDARTCYDHLAGRLGVAVLDALCDKGLVERRDGLALTVHGAEWLTALGADVPALRASRRPMVRDCLDWTERRHHLAGAAGAAVCERFLARGWIERTRRPRALRVSESGRAALADELGLAWAS